MNLPPEKVTERLALLQAMGLPFTWYHVPASGNDILAAALGPGSNRSLN